LFKSRIATLYKKHKSVILKITTSPLSLSFIISVIIIYFLPSLFKPYKATLVKQTTLLPHQMFYYADLNGDGISEKIEFRQSQPNLFYITVTENKKVLDQWNFNGKMLLTHKLITTSIGRDSLKSIYFFLYKNHKIYLNCLNPFEHKFIVRNKFVSDFTPKNNFPDCKFIPITYYDSNNDGIQEFYFYSIVGYPKQPRKVFRFDPENDSLINSGVSYASLGDSFIIETNKNINICFATRATGNSDNSDPYSDMFSWIMDFNKDLKFKFKPINIGNYTSKSDIVPLKVKGHKYYVVMNIYAGMDKHLCSLRLYDTKFKQLKKITFPTSPDWIGSSLYTNTNQPNYFYVIRSNGSIERRNEKFKIVYKTHVPPLSNTFPLTLDINHDGQNELLFESKNRNLVISRNNFSSFTVIKQIGSYGLKYHSIKVGRNKRPELVLASDNHQIFFTYQFNYLFYLKYPFYVGVYLVIFLLILLIEKAQKHRAELKFTTEKQIAELQLKSIKNQIDPHFTLNTLNAIGSLIYKQDREQADYLFGKYSKLLRSTILYSDKIVTTLKDELEYVENYLELEKFRNNNKFKWNIQVDDSINKDIKIPKLLIHTFVENAIKHGIRPLQLNGKLYLIIENAFNEYKIIINDNGIGRNEAQRNGHHSTGKGLTILDQILNLYYNLKNVRITYRINDMVDSDQEPLGTEVIISIPAISNG